MDPATLLSGETVRLLAWTLVHSLWQLALVGLAVAALLPWLGRQDARARHGLCLVGLALMALLPLVTFGLLAERGAPSDGLPLTGRVVADGLVTGAAAGAPSTAAPLSWTAWLTGLWALGASLCLARTIRAWRHDRRLGREGQQAAPPWLRHAADLLARDLGLTRGVRVAVSSLAAVPAVVGWTSPVVLLPVAALDALRPDQLRAVLAHELAHVARHDALVNLFQACLESLFFFHPAVWWLSGRLRIEREYCCDDLAVAASGDALVFARALSHLDALAALPAPRGALSSQGGPLMERISRLVGRTDRPPTGRLAGAALGLVMLGAVSTSAAVLGDDDCLSSVLSVSDGRVELSLADCASDCTLVLRRSGEQLSVVCADHPGQHTQASAPRAASTAPRRYEVRVGDTLPSIAEVHVGGDEPLKRKVVRLRELNPDVEPGRIAVGQSLVLPDDQPAGAQPRIALRQRHGSHGPVKVQRLPAAGGHSVVVLDELGETLAALELAELDDVLAEVDGVLAELDLDGLHQRIDLQAVDDVLAELDIDALVEDALSQAGEGQKRRTISLQEIDDVLAELDIDALVEDALSQAGEGQKLLLRQRHPAPHHEHDGDGHHEVQVLRLGDDDDGDGEHDVRVLHLDGDGQLLHESHQGGWSVREGEHGGHTLIELGDGQGNLSMRLREVIDEALQDGPSGVKGPGKHRVEVRGLGDDGQEFEVHGEVLIVGPDGEEQTLSVPRFQVRRPGGQLPGGRYKLRPQVRVLDDLPVMLHGDGDHAERLPAGQGFKVLRSDDGQTLILESQAEDQGGCGGDGCCAHGASEPVSSAAPSAEPRSVRSLLRSAFGLLGKDESVAMTTTTAPVVVGSVRSGSPAPVVVGTVRSGSPAPVAVGTVRSGSPAPVAVGTVRPGSPAQVVVGTVRPASGAPVVVGTCTVGAAPAPVVVGTCTVEAAPAPVVVGTCTVGAAPAPVVVGTCTVETAAPAAVPVLIQTAPACDEAPAGSEAPPAPPCEQECDAVETSTEADVIT